MATRNAAPWGACASGRPSRLRHHPATTVSKNALTSSANPAT